MQLVFGAGNNRQGQLGVQPHPEHYTPNPGILTEEPGHALARHTTTLTPETKPKPFLIRESQT